MFGKSMKAEELAVLQEVNCFLRNPKESRPSPSGSSEQALGRYSCTTCFTAFEVLAPKFESPAYTALMEMVPTGSVDVTKVAVPPLSDPVPSTVLAFMNETASPSGGAPRADVTVAEKVTASPYVDGFGEDESVVAVAAAILSLATKASNHPSGQLAHAV